MNKSIAITFVAVVAFVVVSEGKFAKESRFFIRKPWIPLPPINRPPTNPAPTPATSCEVVEGCVVCNTANDSYCDGPGGTIGACYMEYCAIDSSGTIPYCQRGCFL